MCAKVIASSDCRDGSCPTLYRVTTTAGTQVAVQGYTPEQPLDLPEGIEIPTGEAVVLIPADVFEHLVEQYLAERTKA